MCAGLRDTWNLAWKLDRVMSGQADEALLDTYEPERKPHVSDDIDASMFPGSIICIPDPEKAAERYRMFLSGEAPPPAPFPITGNVGVTKRPGELGIHSMGTVNMKMPDLKVAEDFYAPYGLDVREDGPGLGIQTFDSEHRWAALPRSERRS